MLKLIALLTCSLLLNTAVFGQKERSAWKIYTVGERKISISLPKLPVVIKNSYVCSELEQESFYAYEKEIVYSLTINAKAKEKPPEVCGKKDFFSAQTYNTRLEMLKKDAAIDEKTKKNLQNRELTSLHSKTTDYWIYNDLKNDRWIELSAIHREDTPMDAKEFANSFKFEANNSGIEIGDGSPITLGDADLSPPKVRTTEPASEKSSGGGMGNGIGGGIGSGAGNGNGSPMTPDNPKAEPQKTAETSAKPETVLPILIVAKPRANYTEAARLMQAQGTVTLRVTFQANGGIGNISVISGIDYGLNDVAIAAAKKMVFFPAKKNGVLNTVVKQVQYSFTIY